MYSLQSTLGIMEGLLPYARGFFYHFPVTTSQLNTWHPHIYDKPAKSPTPFYISNILDLRSENSTEEPNRSPNLLTSSEASIYSKEILNAGRLLGATSRYHGVVRTGSTDVRQEKEEEQQSGHRTAQSPPCPYLRDRVESPQEGILFIYLFPVCILLCVHTCCSGIMTQ